MRVCHVTTHDISRGGGTEIAVRNIMQHHEIKSLGSGGIFLYLKSFFLAVKLIFSNYDIIHLHDMSGYGYTFVPKFLRKKTVYSCHGLWETYFGDLKNKSISQKILSFFLERFQRRIMKKSDVVVATSMFRRKSIKSLYNINSVYIHNGVDLSKFKPMKIKKEFDFIWVGTNPNKGLKFATKIAKKNNGNLIVVGLDGKNSDKISYIKHVKHDNMPIFYNKSRTLVNYSLLSRYDFVVLEAMACGINVIINKESANEFMPDGRFSKSVFVSGRKGVKLARKLSWEKAIKKYNAIYSELVK